MLEIVLVEKEYLLIGGFRSKLIETTPIPAVGLCQIVTRESIPGCAFARTAEGLFVERCPHITIGTAHTFVIGAAQVVPKAVVMI